MITEFTTLMLPEQPSSPAQDNCANEAEQAGGKQVQAGATKQRGNAEAKHVHSAILSSGVVGAVPNLGRYIVTRSPDGVDAPGKVRRIGLAAAGVVRCQRIGTGIKGAVCNRRQEAGEGTRLGDRARGAQGSWEASHATDTRRDQA
ncbi:hypothetical protein [Sphingomonas sp.]|uniref:hypothetical protein n=1 Tax=Sphingomonas sp. TaxID=28214 RepID=UPI002FD8A9DD